MAKQFDEGLTSAAFGLAPMGAQPQGQPAGDWRGSALRGGPGADRRGAGLLFC